MIPISLEVNGRRIEREVEPRMHLGDFVREQIGLTGTHLGCEHGVCGACVVLLDGQPVRACITFAVACDGHSVTTIEGHENDPVMTRLRAAFSAHHALQCGYCTPGMLATARDIVLRLPRADERRIRAELSGNLCRCTGYQGIVNAIAAVLADLQTQPDPAVEALRGLALAPVDSVAPLSPPARAQIHTASSVQDVAHSPSQTAQRSSAASPSPGRALDSGAPIVEHFDLPFHADQVWALMSDPARVAACLPGAFLSAHEGERITGGVALRFGPMQAKFEGDAQIVLQPAERRARLQGQGRDRLTQSRAEGDIDWQVSAIDERSTRVSIAMRYTLQGPFAQFSRSGLVQEFVRRIVQQFAGNVSRALTGPDRLAGSTEAVAPEPTGLNPISVMFAVLWARLRRWFGSRH